MKPNRSIIDNAEKGRVVECILYRVGHFDIEHLDQVRNAST